MLKKWLWCTLLWLRAAAAVCQLPGSCGTSRMLQLGPACSTDPVQGSTAWQLLSGSTIKKDIELQRNFGESSLYNCISQRPKSLCLHCFWGWLVLLFVLNTSPALWQDQLLLGSPLVRTPFFCPPNISALFCLRYLWPSFGIFQWVLDLTYWRLFDFGLCVLSLQVILSHIKYTWYGKG